MSSFSAQIKLHALDERKSNTPWKEIQQSIREKFGVNPPTTRAMEKWVKELDRDKLSKMIIEESQKHVISFEAASLQQMAEGLLPVLWRARDAGADMELESWIWFLSVIERQLGEAKFEHFLSEYMKRKSNVQKNTE